ncbi:hypothetical protein EDB85DRAFT_1101440 [Lactarius pseudohatsudake]|nr:hypothetical protein EDB85DRAFT_1101440 [Lactarius pseudohatsudake]
MSRTKTTLTTLKSRSSLIRRANNGAYPRPGRSHTRLPYHSLDEQSSPITPPDVNSLAGLPLTILPEPAHTEIAISPRALSHLHSSPDPPDPARKYQETQQYAIRQGFCYEGTAIGAPGLLATSPAAEPSPVSNSGACATSTSSAPATATDSDDRRMRVWISTSTSTTLWTSRPGPRTRMRSKTMSCLRTPRRHCCAPRVPMTIQTGPCSACDTRACRCRS